MYTSATWPGSGLGFWFWFWFWFGLGLGLGFGFGYGYGLGFGSGATAAAASQRADRAVGHRYCPSVYALAAAPHGPSAAASAA